MQHRFAELVRNVFNQRAAPGHVQDLRATADAKRRQPGIENATAQFKLEGIALLVDAVIGFMTLAAIAVGIDVSASCQDQRIEHLQRRFPAMLARRNQERHAAGAAYRVEVVGRERIAIVDTAAVGGQADEWMRASRRHGR